MLAMGHSSARVGAAAMFGRNASGGRGPQEAHRAAVMATWTGVPGEGAAVEGATEADNLRGAACTYRGWP